MVAELTEVLMVVLALLLKNPEASLDVLVAASTAVLDQPVVTEDSSFG